MNLMILKILQSFLHDHGCLWNKYLCPKKKNKEEKKKKRMNDKNGIKLRSMIYCIGVSFKKEFSDIFKNN